MKNHLLFLVPALLAGVPLISVAEENEVVMAQVVQATLDYSPIIRNSSYAVDVARGAARMQSGAFNIQTQAALQYDNSHDMLGADMDNQGFSAGLTKRFRSGVGTSLTYDLNRMDERYAGAAMGTLSNSRVRLMVEVPFLKGGWEVSAGADEKSAILEQQASEADFRQLITETLLGAIQAYWNYSAAYRIEQYRQSAKQQVEDWISGNPNLSTFLTGFLEEQKANLVTATQQLEQSRLELARAIGIPIDKSGVIGKPDLSAFPTDWDGTLKNFNYELVKSKWTDLAVQNRNDIRAARLRLDASEVTLAKAKQDLYPELTARGSIGYGGVSLDNGFENYLSATHRNVRGADHGVSLNFSYPLGNDAAEGYHDITQAQKFTNNVTLNETIRGISLSVEQDVAEVYGRLQNVVQNRRTMESYINSIDGLVSTSNLASAENVTNLIVLQDKLNDASVTYITVLAELGNAIARARFQTGVLIDNDDNINIEQIAVLPDI